VVLITKSKTPTSTVLVIERQVDNNNDRSEKNEYVAGGEHSGIVISKIGKYGKNIYFVECYFQIYISIQIIAYNIYMHIYLIINTVYYKL